MFSLVSKIVRRLTRLPFSVLALSAILAVLSIFPISQLRWDIQLQDTLSFYDQDPTAAWLQLPYLLWVLFAAYLNLGVWKLN